MMTDHATVLLHPRWMLVSLLAAAIARPAAAGDPLDFHWQCPTGGDFSDPGCWVEGAPPGSFDVAIFDVGQVYTVVADLQTVDRPDQLIVRSGMMTLEYSGPGFFGFSGVDNVSIIVGDQVPSSAMLTLTNAITFASDDVLIGRTGGALGLLHVTGPDTSFIGLQDVVIGRDGIGILDVTDGAAAGGGHLVLAEAAGAAGSVTVSDAGSSIDDINVIGKAGLGLFDLCDGATATSGQCILGQQINAIGEVELSGTGTTWTAESLDVGLNGYGRITVEDGATLSVTGFASLGTFATLLSGGEFQFSEGEVTVDGAGSTFDVNGTFELGFAGIGTLTVGNKGTVSLAGSLSPSILDPERSAMVFRLGAADDYPTPALTANSVFGFSFAELRVKLEPGFAPSEGDAFHLINAGSISQGTTIELPAITLPLRWVVDLTNTDLAISVINVPSDVNADGVVDVDDVIAVVLAFGPCPDPPDPCPADVNGGGAVDVDDVILVVLEFD